MPSATTNNILTLSFVPLRAAFVNLPPSWAASLLDTQRTPNDFAVHLQWSETERRVRETYVSWAGGSSSSPVHQSSTPQKYRNGTNRVLGVLEIDPIYANAIGLKIGQEVTVRVLRSTLNATTVHVEPLTPDDWEILELHAGYVEEQLLNQVRVLCTNQVVVVWIHHRTTVKLRIVKTEPEGPYVKLNADTEVIVAPKQRRTSKKDDEANKDQTPPLSLRLLPFELLTGYTADSFDKTTTSMDTETFNLQLHPDDIPLHYKTQQIVRISKLEHAVATQMASKPSTPVQPDGDDQKSQKEGEGEYKEHSSLHLRVIENTSVLPGHAAVARIVREQLSLDWFDKILLQKPSVEPLQDYSITLQHTNLRMKSEDAKESFLEWISRLNHRPVLTDGAILLFHESENPLEALFLKVRLSSSRGGELESDSKGLYFILPDMERIDQDSINIMDVTLLGEAIRINSESSPYLVPNLGGVNEIIDNAVCYCKARLSHPLISERLNLPVPGGVLLFSNHGGGKTSVTRSLTARLARDSQCFAYTRFVACTELAEARIPLVKAKLREAFDEASWREPSVIVFDDLDKLLPAEMENADSSRTKQLTECFLDMALTVCSRRRVVLLATAKHQQSLHPILVTSHLFSQLLHIPLPEKARRKQILESIVSSLPLQTMKASFESVDFLTVASTTEGYSPADLQTLVERAVHESAIRNASDEWIDPIVAKGKSDRTDSKPTMHEVLTVEQTDFADAQNGFVPFSLRDVKLQKSDVRWADIGGMEETKRVLLETLEWPTKYAAIFASCPLRLRSGLLLYGYPGCGKTLLASAIAHECGLSFISVKGPELLNKYIGASEKSVRDLFERAQAAKPCVLFFDEFDSIAPRRGNDNTGVTDRVVNQLLTQMDGAEGLQGVYVLAATSRPELIDPALLRPGRLDKSLLCDMPNDEDRNDILRAQSAKVYLADDVDLAEFARKTEGFSGADLQSLLSNGQLEAIHEVIDLDNGRVHEEKEGSTKVTDFVMVSNQGELKLTNAQRGKIGQRMSYLVEQRQQAGNKNLATTKPKLGALEFEKQSEIVITKSQLLRALENTKPSLSAVERRRFEAIYRSFVSERGEGVKEKETGLSSHATGARSTLM